MQQIALTKQAIKQLKPALKGAKAAITKEIRRGVSQLFITDNKELLLVIRPEGETLVIVAAAGKNLIQVQAEIIGFAKNHGFKTIRFYTTVPKALKKGITGLDFKIIEVRKQLFKKAEYVYEMVI